MLYINSEQTCVWNFSSMRAQPLCTLCSIQVSQSLRNYQLTRQFFPAAALNFKPKPKRPKSGMCYFYGIKTMGIKKSLEESKNPAFCMPLIFGKLLARSSVKKQFRNNRLASEFLGYVNPDRFVHHNSCCNCLPFWYNLSDYNFFDACRVPILQKIRKIQCATVNRYGWRRSHSLDSKNCG